MNIGNLQLQYSQTALTGLKAAITYDDNFVDTDDVEFVVGLKIALEEGLTLDLNAYPWYCSALLCLYRDNCSFMQDNVWTITECSVQDPILGKLQP